MPPKGSKLVPPPAPSGPLSASEEQQQANTLGIADFELPKTTLAKLAKGSVPDNVKLQQDVQLALNRGSTVFMNYLSAAAHDQAIARSGKSVTAGDIMKAITEMDFGPSDLLIPHLELELAAYRAKIQAVKASKVPGPGRGRGVRKSNAGTEDVSMIDGDEEEEEIIEGEDAEDAGHSSVVERDDEVLNELEVGE